LDPISSYKNKLNPKLGQGSGYELGEKSKIGFEI
jgi:hypothetical protein